MPPCRLALLICLLAPSFLSAQSTDLQTPNERPLEFRRYDSRDGLSHNSVFDVLQDHLGFIWIATEDGLNRFDGLEFVTYRRIPDDSTSLWDNGVSKLAEDDEGRLWIGTRLGVNRLDRATGRFVRYDIGRLAYIISLAVDSTGVLWMNADGDSIYRLNEESDSFVREDIHPDADAVLTRLHVDAEGTIRIPEVHRLSSDSVLVTLWQREQAAATWEKVDYAIHADNTETETFSLQLGGDPRTPMLSLSSGRVAHAPGPGSAIPFVPSRDGRMQSIRFLRGPTDRS